VGVRVLYGVVSVTVVPPVFNAQREGGGQLSYKGGRPEKDEVELWN